MQAASPWRSVRKGAALESPDRTRDFVLVEMSDRPHQTSMHPDGQPSTSAAYRESRAYRRDHDVE